ncbi:hypothetical protein DL93DRAFT_1097012 [Clavulina sp. PMI_390]|nr:hypothetical protein DL93DRAFT_1097012 [Clavulina sp. PMI_390]
MICINLRMERLDMWKKQFGIRNLTARRVAEWWDARTQRNRPIVLQVFIVSHSNLAEPNLSVFSSILFCLAFSAGLSCARSPLVKSSRLTISSSRMIIGCTTSSHFTISSWKRKLNASSSVTRKFYSSSRPAVKPTS